MFCEVISLNVVCKVSPLILEYMLIINFRKKMYHFAVCCNVGLAQYDEAK